MKVPSEAEQDTRGDMHTIKRAAAYRVKYRYKNSSGTEAP